MATEVDPNFFNRADAVIGLANSQVVGVGRSKVSASCLYGVARFNAWVAACSCSSSEELAAERDEALEYFCEQYRAMLAENMDDYIKHFTSYMKEEA